MMPVGRRRRTIVGTCAAFALLIAVCQWTAGFPLEQAYRSLTIEDATKEANKKGEPPPTAEEINAVMKEETRYTAWFWLAQYATVLSLAMLATEWWWLRNQSGEPAGAICCLDPPTSGAAIAPTGSPRTTNRQHIC
jgi:hypothetical protein